MKISNSMIKLGYFLALKLVLVIAYLISNLLITLYKINKMISCLVRDEGPLLLPNFEILKLYDQLNFSEVQDDKTR